MHDIRKLAVQVLEQGYLMSLGIADGGGVWVSDVIYLFDEDLNIYWMSDPDARHSKAIAKHSQVAASITVSVPHAPNFGIQVTGNAECIHGSRWDLAIKHLVKRGKVVPEKVVDILQGDCWYVLRPTLVELIDEEHFGFEKQKFSLPAVD